MKMRKLISVELLVFGIGLILLFVVFDRTKRSTHLIENVIYEIGRLHENNLKLAAGRQKLINNVKRVEEIMVNQQGR